jgi:hypothetical protein
MIRKGRPRESTRPASTRQRRDRAESGRARNRLARTKASRSQKKNVRQCGSRIRPLRLLTSVTERRCSSMSPSSCLPPCPPRLLLHATETLCTPTGFLRPGPLAFGDGAAATAQQRSRGGNGGGSSAGSAPHPPAGGGSDIAAEAAASGSGSSGGSARPSERLVTSQTPVRSRRTRLPQSMAAHRYVCFPHTLNGRHSGQPRPRGRRGNEQMLDLLAN